MIARRSNPVKNQPKPPSLQCHNCRKRRVRCDASQPSCEKCVSKGIGCPGYMSQKPLLWLQDGGNQNRYLGEINMPRAERSKRKRGRPPLVVMNDYPDPKVSPESKNQSLVQAKTTGDAQTGSLCLRLGTRQKDSPELVAGGECVPETLHFAYPPDAKLIVRTLWYLDKYMRPDLDPIMYHYREHSMDPRSWQDDVTHVLWHILVFIVATHKTIRSQPLERVEFGKEVYQYKCEALRKLNEDLTGAGTQLGDMTLICVLLLLLAEVQKSASGEWRTHIEGARKIIRLRGGLGAVAKHPVLRVNLVYFIIIDVISTTTAKAAPSAETMLQLEYCELIPDLFQHGAETFFICPNELFDSIIQINHLRAISQHAEHGHTPSIVDDSHKIAVKAVLQYILTFSESQWADGMAHHYAETATGAVAEETGSDFIRPDIEDWALIARANQAAVLLYCIRSLALDFLEEQLHVQHLLFLSHSTYASIREIQSIARQALFNCLLSNSPGGKQQRLRKVLIWPLLVAGIEAIFDPPCTGRSALAEKSLDNLGIATGTLSLREASAFLRHVRQRIRAGGGPSVEGLRWESIFEGVKGRYAFI